MDLHTRTAVVRLPLRQLGFLVTFVCTQQNVERKQDIVESFRANLRPRPRCGSLLRSPRPIADYLRDLHLRGGRGRRVEGRGGKGDGCSLGLDGLECLGLE